MEPINPTTVLMDPSSQYPAEIYETFAPVQKAYDLLVLATQGALADGPITLMEIEAVLHANHFMSRFIKQLHVFGIIEPSERGADMHLNACVTAILAMKIRDREIYESTGDEYIKRCLQLLDYIVDDQRLSKKETLAALTQLKNEVTRKIVTVRGRQIKPFKFLVSIERYADREDKDENPRDFLIRVYGVHIPRGLKPAHVRYEDENFYDNLHVWCSRNKVDLKALFRAEADPMERLLTDKQKRFRKYASMPDPES
jgi:hypothetical protein